MTGRDSVQKISDFYRENGLVALAQAVFNVADFSQWPILAQVIHPRYNKIVIESEELREKYSSEYWELDEDLDGLHPNLNEQIAPLQQNQSLGFNYWPRFSFKQPFVAEVPEVTIVGPDAIAITNDGRCLLDTHNSITLTPNRRLGGAIKKAILNSPVRIGTTLVKGIRPESIQRESVASVLHNYWGDNYYHWTLEELLKLRGISQYECRTGQDVMLIVPSNPPDYVTESLRLLGYKNGDYIEWDQEVLHVDRLIVPSFPDPTPRRIAWLRGRMSSELNVNRSDTESSPNWVYVSRQNAMLRRVANYSEVESVLNEYGVQPVKCENLTLEEEIRLFRDVEGIIGPHGAGLTAAIWGTNIHLVEIFNGVIKAPYYVIAHALGYNYTALSGEPVGDFEKRRDRDIRIDVDEFERFLARIVG